MEETARFRSIARSGYERFRRRRFLEALVLGLSVILPGWLLAVGLGALLRFRPESAWLGPGVALAAFAAGLFLALRYGLRHRLTYEQYLRRMESLEGLQRNELINADELESRLASMDDPLSRGLAAQAVDAGIARVRQIRFDALAPARSLQRPGWASLATMVAAAVLFLLAPQAIQSGLARILQPGTYEIPAAIRILVEPGDVVLQRGEPLDVTAEVPGESAGARLFWRSEDGPWRSLDMSADGTGDAGRAFRATLRGVVEDAEYAVVADDARSETFEIQVTEPLRALGYRKNLMPPTYTRIPPSQELSADGNVSAVFGSELRLGIQTGRDRVEGELVWDDGTTLPLDHAAEGVLLADLRVDAERSYRVRLTAPELRGKEWLSRPFQISPVPDRNPTLYQLAPETSVTLPPEMVVEIDADCLDDFGLTRLDLVYRRNDRAPERVRLANWSGEREARVLHPWDLEGIALVPGDVIRYHLELTDNDAISGPKTTRGPECEIRFPSLEELYTDVEEDREEQMGDVGDLKESQEELRKELDRALQDLKRSEEMGWEQQEALKDLAKKQEEIEQKLEDLVESLDESLEKMEQGDLFSPELQRKVEEINELAKQIQNPEFKKQMEELKAALEKLDKDAVEQSLEQMQLSQQDLERSLERTLELLKRLKNEERLDQLVQDAQRLLEEQRQINEDLASKLEEQTPGERPSERGAPREERKGEEARKNPDEAAQDQAAREEEGVREEESARDEASAQEQQSEESEEKRGDPSDSARAEEKQGEESPTDPSANEERSEQSEGSPSPEDRAELQKQQEELQKKLEELQKQLAELQKEAEQNWKQLDEQMKKDQSQKKLDSAQQNMDQSAQQMPSSPQQSMRFGRQAEQDLEQFAQQMAQAQEALAQQEQEDISRQLFHISGELVEVSRGQEDLLGRAPSQPTRDLAAEQTRIGQAARQTLDDLHELGKRSRLLSPDLTRAMNGAVRALESSTRAFERGNRQGAMAEGKASTNTLNETVIELLEANDQMCNNPASGSCNNPMSKMRSLSAQQEQLNNDARSSQQGGQKLQQQGGGGQSLEQLAARQEMIRRGLAELQESMGDRKDVLGRLDELADEMGDVVDEMHEKGKVDERILERQEKILSRLLTAQKSIRREDDKEQRVSRTGENPDGREAPPPVAEELGRQELLRRGILRGSQDPIPDEFRSMVEDYYQSLSRER